MSLLTAVEEAIRLTKEEQAKLNGDIQRYREILQSLKPQTKNVSKDVELADNPNKGPELPPEEQEEIELLEQALEKAMRVRGAMGPFKEPHDSDGQSGTNKQAGCTVAKSKGGTKASGNSKSNHSTSSASKSTGLVRKESAKPGASLSSVAGGGRGTTDRHPGQCRSRVNNSKSIQKCPVSEIPRRSAGKEKQGAPPNCGSVVQAPLLLRDDGGLDKASGGPVPSHHTQQTPASSSGSTGTPQNEMSSEEITKWKSLRRKKDRLWDKVMALQSNPVPERTHFMERMRATFPKDCPPHGSPDQTRELVAKVTRQAEALVHSYQSQQVLLAKQTSAAETVPGSGENKHKETDLTFESLEIMAAEVRKSAAEVKRGWESWDRWRPEEGGCLCTIGVKGEWGERLGAPLPPTVTYGTEAELRELERLRMRVALLQRDVDLQQALSRSLLPQLSSVLRGPGCPQPSVIRDIYSLLADNGEKFPALVLDSDQD